MEEHDDRKLIERVRHRITSLKEVFRRQESRLIEMRLQLNTLIEQQEFSDGLERVCNHDDMCESIGQLHADVLTRLHNCVNGSEVKLILSDLVSQKAFLQLAHQVRECCLRAKLPVVEFLQKLPTPGQLRLLNQWEKRNFGQESVRSFANRSHWMDDMKTIYNLLCERMKHIEQYSSAVPALRQEIERFEEMKKLVIFAVSRMSSQTRSLRVELFSISRKIDSTQAIMRHHSQLGSECKVLMADLVESTNILASVWERTLQTDDESRDLVQEHLTTGRELHDAIKKLWLAWARENRKINAELDKTSDSVALEDDMRFCRDDIEAIKRRMLQNFEGVNKALNNIRMSRASLRHEWSMALDNFNARFEEIKSSTGLCQQDRAVLQLAIQTEIEALRKANRRILKQVEMYQERHRAMLCSIP